MAIQLRYCFCARFPSWFLFSRILFRLIHFLFGLFLIVWLLNEIKFQKLLGRHFMEQWILTIDHNLTTMLVSGRIPLVCNSTSYLICLWWSIFSASSSLLLVLASDRSQRPIGTNLTGDSPWLSVIEKAAMRAIVRVSQKWITIDAYLLTRHNLFFFPIEPHLDRIDVLLNMILNLL